MRSGSLFVALLAAVALPLGAAVITNGGFESPLCTDLYSPVCSSVEGWAPDGWVVSQEGSIDIKTYLYWIPSEGDQSVDLNGHTPGGISQEIATAIGRRYYVSFDLSGNPFGLFDLSGNPSGLSAIKRLRVSAGLSFQDYTFDVSHTDPQNMGWTRQVFGFTADSETTTLLFKSMDQGGNAGPAIDNVSISGAPEPATLGMLGLGLAALAALRRRKP